MALQGTDQKIISDAIQSAANSLGMGFGGSRKGSSAKDVSGSVENNTKAFDENTHIVRDHGKSLRSWAEGLRKGTQEARNIGSQFMNIFRGFADDATALQREGIDTSTNIKKIQLDMLKIGMPVDELTKLTSESRNAVLRLGGFSKWLEKTNDKQDQYFDYTGDLGVATKVMTMNLKTLARAGIEPNYEALEDSIKSTKKFNKSILGSQIRMHKLGVGFEKSSELIRNYTESEEVQARLRSFNTKAERKQHLELFAARAAEHLALGQNVEEILRVNTALESIAGKKAVDRYELAAKFQAAASAMGMKNAAQVANDIRMGRRGGQEAIDRIKEGTAWMLNRQDEASVASVHTEMAVQEMTKDLQDLVGITGISTKVSAAGGGIAEKTLEGIETISQSADTTHYLMREGNSWFKQISNAVDNNSALKGIFAGIEFMSTLMSSSFLKMIAVVAGLTVIGSIIADFASGKTPIVWKMAKALGSAVLGEDSPEEKAMEAAEQAATKARSSMELNAHQIKRHQAFLDNFIADKEDPQKIKKQRELVESLQAKQLRLMHASEDAADKLVATTKMAEGPSFNERFTEKLVEGFKEAGETFKEREEHLTSVQEAIQNRQQIPQPEDPNSLNGQMLNKMSEIAGINKTMAMLQEKSNVDAAAERLANKVPPPATNQIQPGG